jgi:hypothetical protein
MGVFPATGVMTGIDPVETGAAPGVRKVNGTLVAIEDAGVTTDGVTGVLTPAHVPHDAGQVCDMYSLCAADVHSPIAAQASQLVLLSIQPPLVGGVTTGVTTGTMGVFPATGVMTGEAGATPGVRKVRGTGVDAVLGVRTDVSVGIAGVVADGTTNAVPPWQMPQEALHAPDMYVL